MEESSPRATLPAHIRLFVLKHRTILSKREILVRARPAVKNPGRRPTGAPRSWPARTAVGSLVVFDQAPGIALPGLAATTRPRQTLAEDPQGQCGTANFRAQRSGAVFLGGKLGVNPN